MLRLRQEVGAARAKDVDEKRRRAEREERVRKERDALESAIRGRGWIVSTTGGDGTKGKREGGGEGAGQEAVDLQDAAISLSDPVDAESVLHVPLLFLYPMAAQSDFIKSVPETATLSEQLAYVLPVPWEEGTSRSSSSVKEYQRVEDVECFAETYPISSSSLETARLKNVGGGGGDERRKGLIKVGKKIEIATVLGGPKGKEGLGKDGESKGDKEVKRVVLVDGIFKVFVVPKRRVTEFVEEYKRRLGR